MVEMLVGTVLLGVFLAGALPVVAWVRTAQDATEEQRIAALELANQMERVGALPADQRVPERLKNLELSPEAVAVLDDAELAAQVQVSEAFPGLRRIQLSLAWTNGSNQRVKHAQLTGWFKPATPEEGTP